MADLLKFFHGNSKLDEAIWTFSLPAGWTCKGAKQCLAFADPETGTITDGKHQTHRCWAASGEVYPSVRKARWHNYKLLQGLNLIDMTDLILRSLPELVGVVRVNLSGDFFSHRYFMAWVNVAMRREWTRFYWYTKVIPVWVKHLEIVGDGYEPGACLNIIPTASWGGKWDHMITRNRLRSSRVVFSIEEADRLGLEIDHDDRCAIAHGPDFATLLHGRQKQGSEASEAMTMLRKQGWNGYPDKRKQGRINLEIL